METWAKAPAINQFHEAIGYGDWGAIATSTPGKDITFIDFYNTGIFKTFLFIDGIKTEECISSVSYVANRWYKIQLLIGDTQGATFKIYEDSNDDADFSDVGEDTDIFSGDACHSISGGTFTDKKFIAQSYSTGTMTLDNVFVEGSASDSISITSPEEYQVIQRDGNNQADISISGIYTGTPTAIEASWNGGSYTTIAASPSGGTFSGALSNQTAGQGTLTVRFTNDNAVSASKGYVGIGDIFIIAGQSNASGRGTSNQSYSHASLKATLFGNDDNWKELTDPTDSNTNQVDSVSDDSVAAGTVWPLVATLYLADQNVPIAFVPTAKGATAISQWQRNNSDPDDTTTLYGSMYRRINAIGGGVKAVLFWQGENDVIAGTTQASYKSQLDALADDIYSDFAIKTVVAQIGPFTGQDATDIDNIRLAQLNSWNDGANVLPGPSLYDVDLSDTVHFKSNTELETAANRWSASIEKVLYSGADGRGPRISAVEYNSTKTQIRLTFTDDTLPLLPESGFSGFTVKDNDVSATISTIEKIATNQLRVTLSSAAIGTITMSLGEGHTGKGATVPTDSGTYNLPAEIFVDNATTALDETAPTISSVSSAPTSSGATITWATNENASSKIDYGLSNSYGSTTSETDTSPRVVNHSVILSNLVACSTYHYRVISKDTELNETVDSDNAFTTTGCTSSSSSTSTSSSTSSPSCGDQTPGAKAPWLYGAIAQNSDSVLLYFTEADNPVNKYVLEYGTKSGDYPYGIQDMGVNSRGQMTFLVKSLSPNTTYYFKIRGGNGCATGTWSNEISAKTKGLVSFNQLEITQSRLEPQPDAEIPSDTSCQTYTVKSGDTLWSIAEKLLGDGNKYKDIIEQNKDKYSSLSDSNNISSGWELKVNCGKQTATNETQKTPETQTQGGYDVKVKVVDTNKKPVEGAKVTIHSKVQEATTNKEGIAEFKNVQPGDHKVLIAYNNYEGEQSVNLSGDVKEFDLNVTIQQKAIALSPLAYGIIGIMSLVIIMLAVLLIKLWNTRK